jgi:transposase-like protein
MPKPRRQYTDRDRAATLAVLDTNNGNVSRTMRETGVPRTTLQKWAAGCGISSDVPELRQEKRRELGEIFEHVARLYLERAESADAVADTRGKDAIIAAATAFDKLQLTKGAPTSITANLSDEERAQKLAEILERGRAKLALVKASGVPAI